MKYEPYSSNKKGNYVFYIIIIITLVLVAVFAWIGLTQMNKPKPTPNSSIDENTNSNNNSSEYESSPPSYNDNNTNQTPSDFVSQIVPSTPTNDTVENQPYEKSYVMPINGEILKDFSNDTLQFSQTFGDMRLHPAVDIAAKEGTFISAITDGKVQSVEENATLGTVITIDHGDGLIIKYAAIKDSKVKKGDTVKTGDLIGAVATIPSESSDQPHLHIEATLNNKPISIMQFFK